MINYIDKSIEKKGIPMKEHFNFIIDYSIKAIEEEDDDEENDNKEEINKTEKIVVRNYSFNSENNEEDCCCTCKDCGKCCSDCVNFCCNGQTCDCGSLPLLLFCFCQ